MTPLGPLEVQRDIVSFAPSLPHALPIPFPPSLRPLPIPSSQPSLPQADVLVITYTVAEGYALADVLSPGHQTSAWAALPDLPPPYPSLLPDIRRGAPSTNYHPPRLGLYTLSSVGSQRVLLFKSDLHPSTDGPKLPITHLLQYLIAAVRPRLVITTGTAGAVSPASAGGTDNTVILGDVIISQTVAWDCRRRFLHAPFAQSSYTSNGPLATHRLSETHLSLMPVNASRLPPELQPRPPKIIHTPRGKPGIISTDFFAFDTADDHFTLRAKCPSARAVEMDDAALGLAISQTPGDLPQPTWVAVRNASDPQMPTAADESAAAGIYQRYGYITSLGSALVCWALIAGKTPTSS